MRRSEGRAFRVRGGDTLGPHVRWLLIGLVSVAVVLVGANVVYHLGRFGLGQERLATPAFLDLDYEQNVPTYYSALMLTVGAWLSFRIGRLERYARSRDFALWFVMAGALYYVSIDEAAQFHERLTVPLREALGLSGVFFFAWVVPAIPIVAVLTMTFLRFILRLEARTRYLFVLAAALYVGGALGMELVGGYYAETQGSDTLIYKAVAIIEESAEIAGILVVIYALFIQLGASERSPTLVTREPTPTLLPTPGTDARH